MLVLLLMALGQASLPEVLDCKSLGLNCHTAIVDAITAANYVASLEASTTENLKRRTDYQLAAKRSVAELERSLRQDPRCQPELIQALQKMTDQAVATYQATERAYAHLAAVFQDDIDKGVSNSMLLAIRESLSDGRIDAAGAKNEVEQDRRLLELAASRCQDRKQLGGGK